MLDIIAAIFATALYATVAGVLIGLSPVRAVTKLAAFTAAVVWLGIIVAAAALGGLAPGVLGPVPAGLLLVIGVLALLFGSWFFIPQARDALLSLPLPALVALHAGRLGGIFFLLLYFDGRLSAPFAPTAGVGDMITGALALLLTAMLTLGIQVRRAWLRLWNAFGALDLVTAVSLGALSVPGTPFRVFTEGPGTQAMTTLPWVFVPATLVPVFFLLHVAIEAKLKSSRLDPGLRYAIPSPWRSTYG
jgi:hypothetical protein